MTTKTFGSSGAFTNSGTYGSAADGYGVVISGSPVTFTNTGTVIGNSRVIYGKSANDTITNQGVLLGAANGTESGAGIVAYAATSNLNIVNSGTSMGANAGGKQVSILAGGTGSKVTNTGTIARGIYFTGAATNGTVTNAGLIASNTFYGAVSGYGGLTVVNQAGGTITGVNAGSYGVRVKGGAASVTNAGTIIGSTYAITFASGFANRVIEQPTAVLTGKVDGGDATQAVFELASGASTGLLTATGGAFKNFGTLLFDAGAKWTVTSDSGLASAFKTISGFAAGDALKFPGNVTIGTPAYSSINHTTSVNLTGGAVETLIFAGKFNTFSSSTISASTFLGVVCFLAGTPILAENGEAAVEALRVGDRVATVSGALAPIVWIGHRRVDCRHHPDPARVWPVRIPAGAFGPGVPRVDVSLSPDHAVYVDGVLIPAKHLIGVGGIAQSPVDVAHYYHIELERHDIVLAAALPVESYLDAGDRASLSDTGGVVRLHPDFGAREVDAAAVWEMRGYAPLAVRGPVLAAVRRRLAAGGVGRVAEARAVA